MNDTRKNAKEKKTHSANHLASTFISSKRSLKKIYNLNPYTRIILRYICDCIDKNHRSKTYTSTKLYKSQIGRYCGIACRKAVRRHIAHLISKKLITLDEKKHIYGLGKVLITWGFKPHQQDMGFSTPSSRWGVLNPISNSSNLSKGSENIFDRKNENYIPSESAKKVSDILEDWAEKKGVKLT